MPITFSARSASAPVVLASAWVISTGFALGQSAGTAPPTRQPSKASVTGRQSPTSTLIYKYVKMQKHGELDWQRIPWLGDFADAIRQAKLENRPLFCWITADDPLDRC
jgi:hypothetical protein